MIRLAILNSHPVQYFAPLYRQLAAEPWVALTVFYASRGPIRSSFDPGFGMQVSWDIPLLDGYKHEFLTSEEADRGPGSRIPHSAFDQRVVAARCDAIWFHGYRTASALRYALSPRETRPKLLVRTESHLLEHRSFLRQCARWVFLRPLYRRFDGALYIGRRNREFYEWCGLDHGKMFHVPYVIDNGRFQEAAGRDPSRRAAVRKSLGLPEGAVVVLFASKFIARKRPLDLLNALDDPAILGTNAHVLLIGSGPDEHLLRERVKEKLDSRVTFAGFRNQAELPGLYAAADVFVLPSESEPWGLVVNEAMCAGLPIITTREIGAAADLVTDGLNGAVYEAGDVGALRNALGTLISNAKLRTQMGEESLKRISTWGIKEAVAGVREACAALFPANGIAAK